MKISNGDQLLLSDFFYSENQIMILDIETLDSELKIIGRAIDPSRRTPRTDDGSRGPKDLPKTKPDSQNGQRIWKKAGQV